MYVCICICICIYGSSLSLQPQWGPVQLTGGGEILQFEVSGKAIPSGHEAGGQFPLPEHPRPAPLILWFVLFLF